MRNVRLQNTLLLAASYAVYWYLDARMLWLLVAATLLTYAAGLAIERLLHRGHEGAASCITTLGVTLAVALLVAFKYLDFFATETAACLNAIGLQASWTALHLILPIGLSFYVFKLISYLVEIHREHIPAEHDILAFAAYIAFFPTILAGPIDRPQHFLPQLHSPRQLDWEKTIGGAKMILWGAFMKVCIADQLAPITDMAWDVTCPVHKLAWWTFLFYPVQMYADFSGYSLMAIGVGRMLGLQVTANFKQPFLARNVAEYWRRWHMSLTSWVTDYVFIPLNIRWRNLGKVGQALAVTINLVVIGMWHGANWTYFLFGLYHALLFFPLIYKGTLAKRKKLKPGRWGIPAGADLGRMLLTYLLVAVAFVLFRAPDVPSAFGFFATLASPVVPSLPIVGGSQWMYIPIVLLTFVWEYVERDATSPLHFKGNGLLRHRMVRWAVYYILLLALYTCSADAGAQFIYTQF